jgi:nucleotide-binding universal stress UspA family protein
MATPDMHAWSKPRSIAVATDLTDLEYLLPIAKVQATASHALLWLVHVIPASVYGSPDSGAYPCVPAERVFRDATATLAQVCAQVEQEGVSCSFEVRRWFAAEQITAFVREKNIDRLILGTSGKGKVGKFLLGSVAEELIRTIDIPVCTIGPQVQAGLSSRSNCILLALSLQHSPEVTLQFAMDVATAAKSHLVVLHVLPKDIDMDGGPPEALSRIHSLLSEPPLGASDPELTFRVGEPAEQILQEASAREADMLVIGAVPAATLASLLRTGVAYAVIVHAHCPVLTLRNTRGASPAKSRDIYSAEIEDLARRTQDLSQHSGSQSLPGRPQ